MVLGEEINHLAMGHYINHPKRPFSPNVFINDIEIEHHFLPHSFLEHLPNSSLENMSLIRVLGVFLMEETHDNTELLIDLKELHLLQKEQ